MSLTSQSETGSLYIGFISVDSTLSIDQLIRQPHQIDGEKTTFLESVIKKYPFFEAAHLLYLKGLHNAESMHFDSQLNISALYVYDRAHLYDLIHDHEKSITEDSKPAVSNSEIKKTQEKAVTSKTDTQEDLQSQTAKSPGKLDKTILAEALAAQYSSLFTKQVEKSDDFPNISAKPIEPSERDQKDLEEDHAVPNEDTTTPIRNTDKKGFSEWLSQISGSPTTDIKDTEDQTNTNQPKAKATFFSAEKAAKESIREDGVMVSETLANIYYQQGNFAKAIEAYQQLMLKKPEKKGYFAERIKKIEDSQVK